MNEIVALIEDARTRGVNVQTNVYPYTRGNNNLASIIPPWAQEGGSMPTVYAHHTDKDMQLALVQPWCSIDSDGSALAVEGALRRGNLHPRNFGTFPRVLGVYVRELKVLRLEDAVRKMTSLNAAKLGIVDRGLLRPGNFADITLFDAEKVADRSTYEKPFQYSEGIEYVIVNGKVVLDQGKHTGARPGRALR